MDTDRIIDHANLFHAMHLATTIDVSFLSIADEVQIIRPSEVEEIVEKYIEIQVGQQITCTHEYLPYSVTNSANVKQCKVQVCKHCKHIKID